MRTFRLREAEKEFLDTILNRAMNFVQMRDMQKCCEYACRAVLADKHMLKTTTALLRPVVLAKIQSARVRFFRILFERNARFLALPKLLRGQALHQKASELGLKTRTKTLKVGVATIKDECLLAAGRTKMKMEADIGKDCAREVAHKKKRKECIQKIVDLAQETGVADITLVWRDFSDSSETRVEVALAAIAVVCRLTTVYVMDIHEQTYLYPFPIFQKVIQLLTNSTIFAMNLGEDNLIFDTPHFQLLAARIEDGSLPLRRWFVESNNNRRKTLIKFKLVSKEHSTRKKANADKPNVWTIARRTDEDLWRQGKRDLPRLAWLTAPKSAYVGAIKHKTDMQNKTCNWERASAVRAEAEDNPRTT